MFHFGLFAPGSFVNYEGSRYKVESVSGSWHKLEGLDKKLRTSQLTQASPVRPVAQRSPLSPNRVLEEISKVEMNIARLESELQHEHKKLDKLKSKLSPKAPKSPSPKAPSPKASAKKDLSGKNVVMTGFRDKRISDLVESLGGRNQSSVQKTTDILIIKDESMKETKKIRDAEDKGIQIITKDYFSHRYL